MKLHELQEERGNAVLAMRALADAADTEKRDLNADEDKRFGELKSTISDLDKRIGRAQVLAEAERSAPAIVHGRLGDGQYETRAREFSITKAISAQLGEDIDAGFEREVSSEVKRRSHGRKFHGIAVPDEAFQERRAFGDAVMLTGTSNSPGAAYPLYPTQHRDDLFIDRLRSALVVGRLGATVLDNLVGDQSIPRQTGSATGEWLAEDGDLTDSGLTFDDVELKPKTIGAITSYSRKTLINASPSIEQIVRNDLSAIVANAIDAAALMGTGANDQPVGVTVQQGVWQLSLAGGADWETVLEFVASIEGSDAAVGSLGWALNAWAVKKLRATVKASGEAAGFLMEAPTMLAGFPAVITSALPGVGGESEALATVIFGAWSQLLVGYWSGTDILVNPYADSVYARGRVMVRVMRDCDVAVRHPEAFAFADDLPVGAAESA
jgi:HK97 family phage major capsid protein